MMGRITIGQHSSRRIIFRIKQGNKAARIFQVRIHNLIQMLNPLDGFNILDHGLNLFAHGTILAQQVNVDIVGDFVRT